MENGQQLEGGNRMIKVFYSPQVNENDILTYEIQGEVIKATLNRTSDIFNFTELPDGIVEKIETDLQINPVIYAEREDGILYVELLNYIKEDATEFEKFPVWIEVE